MNLTTRIYNQEKLVKHWFSEFKKAEKYLGELYSKQKKEMEPKEIIEVVKKHFGDVDLVDHKKNRKAIRARYVAMVMIRQHTILTHASISKYFERDRGVSIRANRYVEDLARIDSQFNKDFDAIQKKVWSLTR